MFNTLLVDDEVLITDGVYDAIRDDQPEGLRLFKAYSARQALEIAGERRIDILVTDINMPGMDGFALYETIAGLWPACRVLFLTGVESFDYAYKTIQYRQVRYIIKAEGISRVIQAVREVAEELNEQLSQAATVEYSFERVSQDSYIRSAFAGYLNGQSTLRQLEEMVARAGLGLRPQQEMALLGGRFSTGGGGLGYAQWVVYAERLNHLLESHLRPAMRCVCLPGHGVILWLCQPADSGASAARGAPAGTSWLWQQLELFQTHCEQALSTTSLLVLHPPAMLEALRHCIHPLRRGLLTLGLAGGNRLAYADMERLLAGTGSEAAQGAGNTLQYLFQLEHWLEQQDGKRFMQELEDYLEKMLLARDMRDPQIIEQYLNLASILWRHINTRHLYQALAVEIPLEPLANLAGFSEPGEAVRYLRTLCQAVFRIRQDSAARDTGLLVRRIKDFVAENLENELTVAMVAEQLHFNAGYLSRAFKAGEGTPLSEYIIDCKMRRAAALLQETELKVQDIAAQLGYSAPANFIRVFKKTFGVTPMEYRRK